jgi:acetyl-CoA synthetase
MSTSSPTASTAAAGTAATAEKSQSLLKETRVFPPPAEFAAKARVRSMAEYEALYRKAAEDPEAHWAAVARELHWFTPWTKTLVWDEPAAQWFVGGKINASYNCLDRHLAERGDKPAILFEGEPGDTRVLTYRQLHAEVCKFANVLKGLGLKAGDTATIYLPMIPEAAIAMLACARIGVAHSVVFGGFSAEALADRNNDAKAKVLITADGSWRRGKEVPLKANADTAAAKSPGLQKVIVVRRTGSAVNMTAGRDLWWHELMAAAPAECPAEPLDSEHLLFLLYTSGSTGKPKGIMHTTGGYLTGAYYTSRMVFDLREDDIYWCTADVGWVTGHTYVVYGPLANGASVVMYEGAPNHPEWDRFWAVVEKYKATILYTAPTAIRAFMKQGEEWPRKHDLSSLRLLGSVGEPINPEAWMWYHRVIGGGRCPIVDTWWQTETGSILMSPLPGATPAKPGSCTRPLPGIVTEVVGRDGKAAPADEGGLLVVRKPWPSMTRGIWGDPARFKQTYWSDVPGCYFTGDGARRDADGYFWITGRVDDVIKVSGHRLGTAEVESALVSHPAVAEAAVVARPDDITGEAIVAFVTCKTGKAPKSKDEVEAMRAAVKKHVDKELGPIARPAEIRFTDALPKTRSGKIMRRLLRKIASGEQIAGDTSTLEDYSVLAKLQEDDG